MKIGIVGSRTFNNYELLKQIVSQYNPSHIVSGGANGADSFAEQYANEFNIPITIHYPNWDKYGKSAGFKRNKLIVDDSEMIIAFWDKKSKGTVHSINLAKEQKKNIVLILFDINDKQKWSGHLVDFNKLNPINNI